jgi:hypothetical protein
MHHFTLTAALLIVCVGLCKSQTTSSSSVPRAYTDEGHWVGLRGGLIGGDARLADRWLLDAMYDWRFDKYWSLPLELSVFKRVSFRSDGTQTFRHAETILALSAALKLRFLLGRPATNFFAQAGVGSASMYPVIHVAAGIEYAMTERLAFRAQVRRYTRNIDIDQNFYSIGFSLDVTTDDARAGHLEH